MLSAEKKTLRALEFGIADDKILSRVVGRLVHPASGRSYHEKFRPPKAPMTDDVCTTALLRPSLLLAVGSCVLALRWALFVRARSFARSYLRLISVCLRSSSRSRVSPWFADRTTRLRRSTAASAPTTSRRRQCAATIASEVFTSRSTPIAPRSTCTARSLASSATAPTCKEPTLARGTTSPFLAHSIVQDTLLVLLAVTPVCPPPPPPPPPSFT